MSMRSFKPKHIYYIDTKIHTFMYNDNPLKMETTVFFFLRVREEWAIRYDYMHLK